MTANNITSPYPYFTDATGAALEAGMIYIGTAGLDPRTNPVAVYQDEAATIPWAQPIRTIAGYPAYQGAPSNIYALPTTYSIIVASSNGSILFRDLNASGFLTAAAAFRDLSVLLATGDGVTDVTTTVAAQVAAAFASGADLFWPAGTYLTTASIPNLHSVRHRGPGIIKRGSNLFYVEPTVSESNTLYASATGNSANDGLSASEPETFQSALTALANYGPELAGKWNIVLAAGTYTASCTVPIGLSGVYPVVITGPDVGGHPNVPTAIVDGDGSASIGIRNRGKLPLYVKNIKFQNWSGSGGVGIASVGGTLLATDNVHGDNNYDTILSYSGRLFVGGGVYTLTTGNYSAIKSMFSNTHSIGAVYDIDTGLGPYPTFVGSVSGTTLTVTSAPTQSQLKVGDPISGGSNSRGYVADETRIVSLGTGSGGVGTYILSKSSTVTSGSLSSAGLGIQISASPQVARGIFIQENSTGHVESVTYNNLLKGLEIQSSGRAHVADSDFKLCGTAIEVGEGSNIFDGGGNTFNAGTANASTRTWAFYAGAVETGEYASSIGTYMLAATVPSVTTLTGTTTETIMYTRTSFLSGHEFSDQGVVRVRLVGNITNSGTPGTKSFRVRLGPGLAGDIAMNIVFAPSAVGTFFAELNLVGTGINTQQSYGFGTTDGASINTAGVAESANVARALTLANGTARDLTITAQLGSAAVGESITLDYVEVHRGGM